MERFKLYQELKNAGFPQGGSGIYMNDPDSNERVYIPTPSEIYATFLGNPGDWTDMVDAMAEVWIKRAKK